MESCAPPGCHGYFGGKLGDSDDPAQQTEQQALADILLGELPSLQPHEYLPRLGRWVCPVQKMRLVPAQQPHPDFDGFDVELCLARSDLYVAAAAAAAFAVAVVDDDFAESSAAAAAAEPALTVEQLAAGDAVLAPDHTDTAPSDAPQNYDRTRDQPEHRLAAGGRVLGVGVACGGTRAWVERS